MVTRPQTDLVDYVIEHTRTIRDHVDAPSVVDCHFFRTLVDESFDRERFKRLVADFLATGEGEFGPIDHQRVAGGPSYIEWGALIGDQGLAMRMMAAGQIAGLWQVITPRMFGVDGPEADSLAGQGMVMTSGYTP